MKRVLIITYYWPPAGGVEVHRVVKFCKYLQEMGWQPEILTVNAKKHSNLDAGLASDISGVTRVTRTSSLEPHVIFHLLSGKHRTSKGASPAPSGRPSKMQTLGEYIRLNVFIPDARIGWYPFATSGGLNAIGESKPDLLFSTAPPYTVHLVARTLSRKLGIPWVADFRDPWVENYAYNTVPRFPWIRAINERMERWILKAADAVVCATPRQLEIQSAKTPEEHQGKFHLITNGYDGAPPEKLQPNERFTLSYFGTLSAQRLPPALLPALQSLCRSNEAFAQQFHFQLIGRFPSEVEAKIRAFLPESTLSIRGHIPHEELKPLMQMEQVMLVLIDHVPFNELILPAKVFEILPTGNPMLGVGPVDGDAANMIRNTGSGAMFRPTDQEGIEEELLRLFAVWSQGTLSRGTRRYESVERKQLTQQLREVFESVTP